MDFRILGSLEVYDDGRPLSLGGHQQRALLALLLLRANQVVPVDEIVEDLWGARPPPSATKSVQALVSKLRKLLADEPNGEAAEVSEHGILLSRPHGYLLRVAPGELDLDRFQSLTEHGRRALAAGRADDAAEAMREALALWHGPPLAELAYDTFAQVEIARLAELRLSALEERIEADLALGRHQDLIPEVEALVAENPLRERLRGQLMLALYRSGRQAEALQAYQRARHTLVDELGIEPGQALQRLEQAILRQDGSLDPNRKSVLAADISTLEPPVQTSPPPDRLSGAVTFLFTDIERSTRLVKQLRERWSSVVAEHQRILREAFAVHRGQEIDTHSDSFFVAFGTARDAVLAAADGQRALAHHAWPEGADLRVRMGIHSGQAAVSEDRYRGLSAHRAAGICAVAHGGQVLISQTTVNLLEDEEDELPGVELRDLGEQRLKDFDRPVRLSQLVVEGLPSGFPPLDRGVDDGSHAGREEELAEAAEAVLSGARRRRRLSFGIAAVAAVAIAALGALAALRGGDSIIVRPNSVAVMDPETGKLVAQLAVGSRPTLIAYDGSARRRWVWVANADDQTLSRINPTTREQNGPVVSLGATPAGLAVGFGSVWVLDRDAPQLLRVDPEIGRVLTKIPLPLAAGGYFPAGLTVGARSVWAAYDSPGQLVRVDPASGRVVKRIVIGSPTAIAFGAEAVWIGGPYDGVTRIDPSTNTVRHYEPLPNTVTGLAVGNGYVWAAVGADDVVWQLDTDGNVQRSFGTGPGPAGITISGGAVWVANSRDGTVTRVDPSDPNARTATGVGNRLAAIVAVPVTSGTELWLPVTERPAEPLLPPNGARIVMGSDAPSSISPALASVDPAIAFSPQAYQWEYATAAKLFNYPDEPPPAGLRPQPELAAGLPAVSDGGTTYTFRIRSGFRFSPPSNELVTAATVRDSIERALSPELGPNSPGLRFADVIKGDNAYHAGTAAHVAGLRASGDTLTIRLTRPVGDLLHRLALPMFSVVPRRTPVIANGLAKPVPSAGPYYVASYTPGQQLVLRRNPHYTGPRPHVLDEFVYTFGQSADQSAGLVKAGQADYTTPGLPPAFPILSPAFAPGGVLDRTYGAHGVSKPQRFFLTPTLSIGRLAMNTSRGIFRDARLRRAVNFALERSALAAQLGPLLGGPSDQYLPVGMPGSRDTHIYPLARPNLARARALARGRGGQAMLWTCNLPGCLARAEIIRRSLAPLGIHVTVKSDFPVGAAVVATSKRGANFDLSPFMSTADLPDPGSFLRSLFDGSLLRATGNTNVSYFDDVVVNARLARADRLSGRARERAFGRIAADLAREQAPIAVFSQPYQAEFVSERLGCLTEQPVFGGLDLAALCLREDS